MRIKAAAICLFLAGLTTTGFAQADPEAKAKKTPDQIAENMTNRMDKSLDLSDEQKTEITALNKKNVEDREAHRAEVRAFKEEMKKKKQAQSEAYKAELKKVLTEEQYKKLEEMEAKRKEEKSDKAMTERKRP